MGTITATTSGKHWRFQPRLSMIASTMAGITATTPTQEIARQGIPIRFTIGQRPAAAVLRAAVRRHRG